MTITPARNVSARGNYTDGVDRILNMPRCSVYRVGADSFSGVQKIWTWDTLDYQSEGMWSASFGTQIRIVTGGCYRLTTWIGWASDPNAYRQVFFIRNGTGNLGENVVQAVGGAGTIQTLSIDVELNAADYVQVASSQGNGGSLAIIPATSTSRENGFQACMISTL